MADSDGAVSVIRLRCHFGARDPQRCRACNGAGFTEIAQAKYVSDHLKRVHPAKCPNCHYVFAGKPIAEHARQHPNCKYRPKEGVEYLTEKKWQDVRKVPKRCRNTSPGDQWKVIFKKLFGSSARVPPPYLPSVDQYRRIANSPTPGLISELERRILSSGHVAPFHVCDKSLRSCLRLLVPNFFDLVSEHGLIPRTSAPVAFDPHPQHVINSEYEFDVLDLNAQDGVEGILALEGSW